MKESMTAQRMIIATSILLLLFATLIGCASDQKLEKEISGTWQRSEGGEVIAIKLAEKIKSIAVGPKVYPATIEKVDLAAYLVSLKVKTDNSAEEMWTLRQVWNNNGSDFTLVFDRNGSQEKLVHSKQS